MVVNTHYKNNLKAVMQVNKAYTDDKIQEVLDLVSDYNVNSQEVEQLSTSATAPNKDIRTTSLMVIGGNSVKYAPSTASDDTTANLKAIPENTYTANVDTIGNTTTKLNPTFASDDTTALVKTMPSTVYDFDVSKVEGNSVKYNQLFETTDYTLTRYNVSITRVASTQTITITTNGTASANGDLPLGRINYTPNHKYLFHYAGTKTSLNIVIQQTNGAVWVRNKNASAGNDIILDYSETDATNLNFVASFTSGNTPSATILIEIIDLTDIFGTGNEPSDVASAIPLLKANGYKLDGTDAYNTGEIHNLELSGLKVEGFNVWDEQVVAFATGIRTDNFAILPSTTYYVKTPTAQTSQIYFKDSDLVEISNTIITTNSTFTTPTNCAYILMTFPNYNSTTYNHDICINISGSANGTYQPYVAPTTKTIDLSTILYNGSPLFEGNSLKAVGTAKDYITPYLAHKEMVSYTFTGNETITQTSTVSGGGYRFNVELPFAIRTDSAILSNRLEYQTPAQMYSTNRANYGIAVRENTEMNTVYIYVVDIENGTPTDMKNWLINNPTTIVIQLATPIEVSIDWSSTLRGITGYSNGSITAQNTYDMAVHSVITYNSIIENDYADSVVFSGNLAVYNDVAETTINGITYSINNGTITLKGTANNYTQIFVPLITSISSGTFSYNQFNKVSNYGVYLTDDTSQTNIKNILTVGSSTSSATNIETSFVANYLYIYVPVNSTVNEHTFTPMLIKGSTAPSVFKPYVAPITKTIPSEIKALDGYNYGTESTANYVDFNNKKFNKVIGRVDLSSLSFDYELNNGRSFFTTEISTLKGQVNSSVPINALCEKYNAVANNVTWVDKNMAYRLAVGSQKVTFVNNDYTDATTFKTAMSGVYLYYELATPIQTDISQYLANFNPILTNNNYTNYEVVSHSGTALPNKISYIGTIKDTLVDSIDIDNGGGDTSSVDLTDYTIESDGWSVSNTVFNYRAFREGNRHKVIGRVDLGTIDYSINNNNFPSVFVSTGLASLIKSNMPNAKANILCANYTVETRNDMIQGQIDKSISVGAYNIAGTSLYIADTTYSGNPTALKQALNGVYLYFELATEEITPLNLPRNFYRIDTKQNGVTTFNNDNNQACHNTLRYYYKEAKSNE